MNTFNATGVVNQSPVTADVHTGSLIPATGKLAGKGRAWRKGEDLAGLGDGAAGESAEHVPASEYSDKSTAALRGNDAVTMAQVDIRADTALAPQGGAFAAPATASSFSPWVLGAIGLGAATAVAASSRDHGAASTSTTPSVASPTPTAAAIKAPDGTISPLANVTATELIAPPIAQISGLYDDAGIKGQIINGTVTDDARPSLAGHATAGTTVTVRDSDAVIGTVLASPTGYWSFAPKNALTDGSHTFTVTATDSAGLSSASSAPIQFTVNTAPVFVTLDGVFDDTGGNLLVAIVGSTGDASPQLKGTATPGATVDLYDTHGLADAAATKIGTVIADGTGHWTYTPTLDQGLHGIYAYVGGAAGVASSAVRDFIVTTSPAFVTLDEVLDNVGSSTGLVEYRGSTDDASPQLKGTATPGATVELYDTHGLFDALADKIGTVIADASGHWTYTPTLDQGLHGIYARVGGTAGIASTIAHDFTITASPAVVAPVFVTLDGVFDDTGGNLLVAIVGSTGDASPQLKGTATPGATVDLYDTHGLADAAATKIGTVIADGTGHWTYTPTLDQGLHGIYAYVGGTAGVASSAVRDFIVTTSPAFVTLDEVLDNVGSSTGLVEYFGSTDDASPQLKGTATPGATVDLYDTQGVADASAVKIGTVIADGTGHWTYTPTLDQGLHGIYAYVGGTAGVAHTNAFEFAVDTSTLAAKNTANSTVASFDKYDLSGNGDNTLKLSLDDLLNLGRTDLYVRDGKTQLMVVGDEGDAVELSRLNGNWTSNGTAAMAGEIYAVYQHSTAPAEVFIQHGVTAVLM